MDINVHEDKNSVVISNLKDFDIAETLECGQCFHFDKVEDMEYDLVAEGRAVRVIQRENSLEIKGSNIDDFENIWKGYFDLERDYAAIKEKIILADKNLREVVERKSGIRILNQDFFETLISFIISQNKNIPQIKQCVKNISHRYGEMVIGYNGEKYWTFPSPEALSRVSEEELRECKVGFRAPYILSAVNAVIEGKVTYEKLQSLDTESARKLLMTIKGVGEKVANCVLLFGLGRRAAFPVDVWMKRIMEELYFDGKDTKKADIEAFAAEKFGELGGYAQQYLFDFARRG